ncbi:hypothetical protein F5Y11DRAFT_139014 [Daldinia sp. FL1419]|nr:hypothetical protein F5Y11DRAFT_139014 [Daldinia sp. FL1419]
MHDEEREVQPKGEWTQVHRKGRRHRKAPQLATPSYVTSGNANAMRSSSLSLFDIMEEHKRITHQWEASMCYHKLQSTLKSYAPPSAISNAICFGTGSFDPEDGSWEVRRKAHVQLAAFLSIVRHLQHTSPYIIRCIFQEPAFDASDKAFIRSLGHDVVDSPAGFELVGPSTFAFGIHLYRDVYAQIIGKCLPAIFVGTPSEVWEECYGSTPLDWADLDELNKKCDKASFPEDTGYTTFSSTTIHRRRYDGA